MNLNELDVVKLSKLMLVQLDHTTCLQCCKSYVAPATSLCGHSLCHNCWKGHRTCPTCNLQLDRKALKLNLPLQSLTDHVKVLAVAFEKLFNMKLDEFDLDLHGKVQSENDKNKNVKDWLANSENQFSAPLSQESTQEVQKVPNPLEISASNIQIHTHTKKSTSPPKVVHVPPVPQDDWDKIEPMPDPESNSKNKENIVGPMDIEPFYVDDSEYTAENPRRSSRKRELNSDDSYVKSSNLSTAKHSFRDSGLESEKKTEKSKQTWHNVKKMRKEFSKLNKQNRNKLNVSIEMVKKTQNLKTANTAPVESEQVHNIDDKTPNITNKDNCAVQESNIESNYEKEPIEEIETNELAPVLNHHHSDNVQLQKDVEISESVEAKENNKNAELEVTPSVIKINDNGTSDKMIPNKLPFIKRGSLHPKYENITDKISDNDNHQTTTNADDIEITIKIGNTTTSIVIKKKENDVQVKVNTDRGIQTSLGNHSLIESQSPKDSTKDVEININNNEVRLCGPSNVPPKSTSLKSQELHNVNLNKSTSGKKNTASAETATAQFEITESVEKELSNIMECEESTVASSVKNLTQIRAINNKKPITEKPNNSENVNESGLEEDINDLDIFGSGSIKETNVKILSQPAPSEILVSTVQSKFKTQNIAQKRLRDPHGDENMPSTKKSKIYQQTVEQKNIEHDSEPINYDAVMDQVFANIDADIEDIRKSQQEENVKKVKSYNERSQAIISQTENNKSVKMNNESFYQKHSENVFSAIDKDDEHLEVDKIGQVPEQVEELLTPVLCHNFNTLQETQENSNRTGKSRRKSLHDCDDSDRSVVEETPQKDISFSKLKRPSTSNRHDEQSQENLTETKKIPSRSTMENIKSIINITDTLVETNKTIEDTTMVDIAMKKQTLETPLTITKFANQIKHKSTPVARKSLHFDNENTDDNDPEQTLCPSSVIAKTTQEKEFLSKAFEKTPTHVARPLATKKLGLKSDKRFVLAGSCLSPSDIFKVKYLCSEHNWTYVDKYTNDITHLVVGVDEENKSQRSVKYMCALAASKWIVSFEWVKKCIVTKTVVDEEHFEALDSTGDAGPRRSRTAKRKLFEGITFFCMPPFSVLDVDTLKNMLTAAGGCVASELSHVRVSGEASAPALLLAEPEHTQEDRFIYLTMELQVVPLNYEWALNCLGSYTLGSVQELLLCPSTLLPPATSKWPEVLLAQDYDETPT